MTTKYTDESTSTITLRVERSMYGGNKVYLCTWDHTAHKSVPIWLSKADTKKLMLQLRRIVEAKK